MKYNAFISYSHAADQKLAPSIQQALERIAKPWYKIRNLNIFRDESTLSATPHLWENIQTSLEKSEYFILLASPLAAQSVWVQKEIQYWLDHKSLNNLIIVLTDGDSSWESESQTFKQTKKSALPEVLTKQFEEEPFYIDLRRTNTKQDVSLRNPIFKKEILKIAAQLHGLTPKDLASAEVKTHRRMMQLRNSVAIVLISLLGLSIYKTIEANFNAEMANDERNKAENQRDIALSNNLISEAQRENTPSLALVYANEALNLNPTEKIREITNDIYANNHIGKRILFNHHIMFMDSIAFLPGDQKILTFGDIDDLNEKYNYTFKRMFYTKGTDTVYAFGREYQLWDLKGNLQSVFNREEMEDSFGDPFKTFRKFTSINNQLRERDFSIYTVDIGIDMKLDQIKKAYWYENGDKIVCTGKDGAIRIWDRNSGLQSKYQLDFDLSRNSEDEVIISFSSDGKQMAVFYQRRMELWDLQEKGLLRSKISLPDIKCSSFNNDDSSIQLFADDTSYVWDWQINNAIIGSSIRQEYCLEENRGAVSNLNVEGDFNSLLAIREEGASSSRTIIQQKSKIWYYCLSPNNKLILTGTEKSFSLYDNETDKGSGLKNLILELNINTVEYKPLQALFSDDHLKLLTKGIVEGPDSKYYYLYHLWNLSTGELLKTFPIDPIKEDSENDHVQNINISKDGSLVFINYQKALTIWQSPISLCDFVLKNLFLTPKEIEDSKAEINLWVDSPE